MTSKRTTLFELSAEGLSVITVRRNGANLEIDMHQELEVTLETGACDEELITHAQRLTVLGVLYEEAFESYKQLQNELRKEESRLWLSYKQTERGESGKAISDLKASMLVDNDPSINKLRKKVIEFDHYCQLLKTALQAFQSKERLLQTYSANLRKLM